MKPLLGTFVGVQPTTPTGQSACRPYELPPQRALGRVAAVGYLGGQVSDFHTGGQFGEAIQ